MTVDNMAPWSKRKRADIEFELANYDDDANAQNLAMTPSQKDNCRGTLVVYEYLYIACISIL